MLSVQKMCVLILEKYVLNSGHDGGVESVRHEVTEAFEHSH